jgi:hypothetical protein
VRCTHYGSAICVVDLRHRGVRRGMGVAPAGSDRENSGHQHLLVDTELPALSQPIPNVFNHLHFGAVQTERRAHPAAPVRRQGSQSTWSPVVSPRIKVRLVDPSVRKPGRPMPASISLGCRTVRASPAGDDSLRAICVAPAGSDKPNTGHHPRAAAAPPADPERLQPSPLRPRANGSRGEPPARAAYPSAFAWRRKPRPPQSACDVEADSGLRQQARGITGFKSRATSQFNAGSERGVLNRLSPARAPARRFCGHGRPRCHPADGRRRAKRPAGAHRLFR